MLIKTKKLYSVRRMYNLIINPQTQENIINRNSLPFEFEFIGKYYGENAINI